jgi:hypothetical protein
MLDISKVAKVYSGKIGCMCGCQGKYSYNEGVQHEDWQQGLAIIPFDPETNKFCYEQIAIHNGWAMWRGKNYGQ